MAPYQKVSWMAPNQKILLMPSTKKILWITPTIYFMNDPQPNFYYDPKMFFINGPYKTVCWDVPLQKNMDSPQQ